MSDKYTIVTKLGTGSYGSAWLVINKDIPTKNFVLKQIEAESIIDTQELLQEVTSLQRIQTSGCHPNILCYTEHFFTSFFEESLNKNIIVLNLVTESFDNSITFQTYIHNVILQQQQLSRGIVLKIMKQMLDAMNYIHNLKIAHTDIKPDNILINATFDIQIIDFGLSCTNWCNPITNILYASPETLEKYIINNTSKRRYTDMQKSDIFATGIMLYLLCNLNFPFPIYELIMKAEKNVVMTNLSQSKIEIGSPMDISDFNLYASDIMDLDAESIDKNFELAKSLHEFYKTSGYGITSNYQNNELNIDNNINAIIESMLLINDDERITSSEGLRLVNEIIENLRNVFSFISQK